MRPLACALLCALCGPALAEPDQENELAARTYSKALELVLKWEGGYVNHPADPGGETNCGVTQRVYAAWRKVRGLPVRSVRHITPDECRAIYSAQYWSAIKGDVLNPGVDYVLFDLAVNSGPVQAVKMLQQALGVKVDGHLGLATLAAAAKADAKALVNRICDLRLGFLHRLKTWKVFGRGWKRRVDDVRANGLALTGN
jgi:lysozyme family protein